MGFWGSLGSLVGVLGSDGRFGVRLGGFGVSLMGFGGHLQDFEATCGVLGVFGVACGVLGQTVEG